MSSGGGEGKVFISASSAVGEGCEPTVIPSLRTAAMFCGYQVLVCTLGQCGNRGGNFQETILPSKHVTNSVNEIHTKGVYHKNKIKGGLKGNLPSRLSRVLSKTDNLVEWICRPSTFTTSSLQHL